MLKNSFKNFNVVSMLVCFRLVEIKCFIQNQTNYFNILFFEKLKHFYPFKSVIYLVSC